MICYNLASPDGVENLQSLAEEIAEVFDLGENVFFCTNLGRYSLLMLCTDAFILS